MSLRGVKLAGRSGEAAPRLFRDNLGVTPKRFIIETRLRYARWLVLRGGLSMTAVACQTGFADCAHFATSRRGLRRGRSPRWRSAGGGYSPASPRGAPAGRPSVPRPPCRRA
ncbi:MAG: helix-turn-helix domain-containing protein [Amaricoccus sp.]|uniref:helix-turn-helix domain-containing protein n=1 Tax=Amaricoccus sp. TaxID=1872485 RepID=UPI0033163BF9